METNFNIAIVVFLFKRNKVVHIIDQIAKIKPAKLYLIGDGPRNEDERKDVEYCRQEAEKHITWDCKVIKNYAENNRGVYQNIAGGAKWVFEREKVAIFLEDDNLPSLSFFPYCQELLERYEHDTRVLWVCGTNYMQQYTPEDGSDYVFTQLMLPCGWASWADKFTRFYDGEMELYKSVAIKNRVKNSYRNKTLYNQNFPTWDKVIKDISGGHQPISWDYQMAFSLRANNLFGIAPRVNLIRNIGADLDSIHGGVSMDNIMTARFCEVPTSELNFPLRHPQALMIDYGFESQTEKIIILPLKYRIKGKIIKIIKKLLGINPDASLSKAIGLKK